MFKPLPRGWRVNIFETRRELRATTFTDLDLPFTDGFAAFFQRCCSPTTHSSYGLNFLFLWLPQAGSRLEVALQHRDFEASHKGGAGWQAEWDIRKELLRNRIARIIFTRWLQFAGQGGCQWLADRQLLLWLVTWTGCVTAPAFIPFAGSVQWWHYRYGNRGEWPNECAAATSIWWGKYLGGQPTMHNCHCWQNWMAGQSNRRLTRLIKTSHFSNFFA